LELFFARGVAVGCPERSCISESAPSFSCPAILHPPGQRWDAQAAGKGGLRGMDCCCKDGLAAAIRLRAIDRRIVWLLNRWMDVPDESSH